MKDRNQYHIIVGIQQVGIWEYNAETNEFLHQQATSFENALVEKWFAM